MLTNDEQRFLDVPRFAKLTTLDRSGAPQASVMWYRREGDELRMIAPASSVKARNIAHDPRIAVIVDASDNGYEYLEMRGSAGLIRDDAGARDELRHIAKRYIGDRADGYVALLSPDPRVIIVIRPGRVRHHRGSPIDRAS